MRAMLRPWAAQLTPYRPGGAVAAGPGRLALNESPLAAAPGVARAVADAVALAHRYPDPLATKLRGRLGEVLGVSPEQILVGNGSDELIYLLIMAYAAGGGSVALADPPYRLHELAARAMGARVERVPLAGWAHDLRAMAEVPADLRFVCNPHNPTGTAVSREAVAALAGAARPSLVVVDEAYVEFADDPAAVTSLPLAADEKAVVLRTFSKMHGLAGLRVGYLAGPAWVVEDLRRIRPPFSVNALAQAAAVAALDDPAHHAEVRRQVLAARERVRQMFEERGYQTIPSQANFVLVLCADEEALVARLLRGGVSVRPGSELGVPGSVRVSVPSAAGLELLERALAGTGAQEGRDPSG
jgi:histidinol-phosphate aminotransferase